MIRTIPTEAREQLSNAQFMLGDEYCDWVWKERVKASAPVPKSSKAWPFNRQESNVLPLRKKK